MLKILLTIIAAIAAAEGIRPDAVEMAYFKHGQSL
jgi:hypothetical protein